MQIFYSLKNMNYFLCASVIILPIIFSNKIKKLFNKYDENTKLYTLHEQIKKNEKLYRRISEPSKLCKFDRWVNFIFMRYVLREKYVIYSPIQFNHLHECVLKTQKYQFLNDYIDEYLNTYPNEINVKNSNGNTALFLASEYSGIKSTNNTIKILLKHGADVNIQNNYGETALMYANSFLAAGEAFSILLENGADINMQNENGNTVLMQFPHFSIENVEILLKYKPDYKLRNNQGFNIIDIAFRNINARNGKKIINMLLPNRKEFNKNVIAHDIIKCKSKFWKIEFCDYKIFYATIDSFYDLLKRG